VWSWLLKIEPMGRSFSFYAPFVVLEKLVTFGRVVLLTWVLQEFEFGVWALGGMVVGILAPVATLGSNESVARYVSHLQARGQLRRFYARGAWVIGLLALVTLAAGVAGSGLIAGALGSLSAKGARLTDDARLAVALLGVVNGVLVALYHNLQSCVRALRTFRLLAVLEGAFTLLFTALALALAAWRPTGCVVLTAHAVSVVVMLLAGGYAARRCVLRHGAPGPGGEALPEVDEPPVVPADLRGPAPAGGDEPAGAGVVGRLLRFGSVSMLAVVLWNAGNQVSAWYVNRYHGSAALGLYAPFRQLCRPVWVLSGIVWGLVFSHVASHWESDLRDAAVSMVNLTYKAVVLVLMTLSVLVLVTSPQWCRLLPASYRGGLAALAGLLVFFQCSANLGMASIVAKLHERPVVIVGVLAVGVGANAALGLLWVPEGGVVGAARAAGCGMLIAVALGAVYLLCSSFRTHPAVHALAVSPVLLMLPRTALLLVWAVALAAAVLTPLVFSRDEKVVLLRYLLGLVAGRAAADDEGRP